MEETGKPEKIKELKKARGIVELAPAIQGPEKVGELEKIRKNRGVRAGGRRTKGCKKIEKASNNFVDVLICLFMSFYSAACFNHYISFFHYLVLF